MRCIFTEQRPPLMQGRVHRVFCVVEKGRMAAEIGRNQRDEHSVRGHKLLRRLRGFSQYLPV